MMPTTMPFCMTHWWLSVSSFPLSYLAPLSSLGVNYKSIGPLFFLPSSHLQHICCYLGNLKKPFPFSTNFSRFYFCITLFNLFKHENSNLFTYMSWTLLAFWHVSKATNNVLFGLEAHWLHFMIFVLKGHYKLDFNLISVRYIKLVSL